MHYSCVAPSLAGDEQPCPRCCKELASEADEGVWPHEMEVGAPQRKLKWARERAEAQDRDRRPPYPHQSRVTDGEAKAAGYEDAIDWYHRSATARLAGRRAAEEEYSRLPPPVIDPDDLDLDALNLQIEGESEEEPAAAPAARPRDVPAHDSSGCQDPERPCERCRKKT